jgi:hypothetical protein
MRVRPWLSDGSRTSGDDATAPAGAPTQKGAPQTTGAFLFLTLVANCTQGADRMRIRSIGWTQMRNVSRQDAKVLQAASV